MTPRLGSRILLVLIWATMIAGTVGAYRAMIPEV